MAIELVVFDLAGTTVKDNKDVHRVLQETLADYGVTISIEDANAVMGIPKPVAIRLLLEKRSSGSGEISQQLIDDIHREFIAGMSWFYTNHPDVTECDGVSDVFKKLKDSKLKVVVDTGFDRIITNALLLRLGWEQKKLIDASVTSDEVAQGRPHPDLIFRAMDLAGVTDVSKVAKVGDTASDLQEGNAAGCKYVIGITSGAFTKEQLQKEKHTHLIHHIEEVLEILSLNN